MGYQDHHVHFADESNELIPGNGRDNSGRVSKTKLLVGAAVVAATAFSLGAVLYRPTSKQNRTVTLELEGKHKKSHSSDDSENELTCEDGKYSKRTLQLAYELPFAALFKDNKGQRKYEASSVTLVGDDAYAVCDSSWAISKFGSQLTPFAPTNLQIGDVDREGDDSGYEALFHDDGTFYVIRESIQHDDSSYHAIIEELAMGDVSYTIQDQCSCEFEFEGDSKGFEGAIALRDVDNELMILGLCEGNHCSEKKKDDKGHGRLVAMKKETQTNDDGSVTCQWKTLRVIKIPKSAFFEDYSAITINSSGKVGITSQEESQFWVGQLLGQNPTGLWDVNNIEFDESAGKLYDFPKNDDCKTVYCNIEGVDWINDDMIMAVSDKMKGRGKQDFRCFEKDQSVHVFVLPA